MKDFILKAIFERINRNTAPKLTNIKKYLKIIVGVVVGFFVLMTALVVLVIFLVVRLIVGSSNQTEVPLQDNIKNLEERLMKDEQVIKELTERLNTINEEQN